MSLPSQPTLAVILIDGAPRICCDWPMTSSTSRDCQSMVRGNGDSVPRIHST